MFLYKVLIVGFIKYFWVKFETEHSVNRYSKFEQNVSKTVIALQIVVKFTGEIAHDDGI